MVRQRCQRSLARGVGRRTFAWGLVGIISAALIAPAQGQVRWRSVDAQPQPVMAPALAARTVSALVRTGETQHFVVQFSEPLQPRVRRQVQAAGVELLAYLGDNAFFAAASPDGLDVGRLSRINTLQMVEPIQRDFKLHPMLVRGEIPQWAVVDAQDEADPIIAAYVMFHGDVALEDGVAVAAGHGAHVRSEMVSINGLVIELPYARIAALADEDEVQWIEPALPKFDEVNNSNRQVTQADTVQAPPYNLDGSGVVVMVYDGGSALASHADFGGRLTTHDGTALSNHATHVSGTIGGDGTNSGGLYRGMAPACTLVSYAFEWTFLPFFFADPGDIEQDVNDAINAQGAVLFNASLGSNVEINGFDCAIQGDYGVASALIDDIVRGSLGAPFRMIWAGGNERQGSSCNVEGFGDYYSIAPPAGAKNHITVGALNSNNDSMTSFSSWGPTDDGRIKPDIAAPGCQSNDDNGVTSCSSSGNYTTMCGTSMASPTVCGLSALLLEDFRTHFTGQPDPRNSTLKSWLAHSAVDLGNTGPDYQFGYGSVRIQAAIDLMRSGAFIESTISQGGTFSRTVQVDPGDPELRVTLAWDDAPGTPNVTNALVNDLDLRVTGPGGIFSPWTLNPADPAAPAAQTQADHVNNIEQILVTNPAPGSWTVTVTGFNVPQGPQPFSLVGDGAVNVTTSIVFPNGLPTMLAPGTPEVIDVEVSSFGETTVPGSPTLHYRYDGGSFLTSPLTLISGNLYQATLPGATCVDTPEFYFSAEGSITGVITSPPDAPVSTFAAVVGTETTLFDDDLETDQGWTVGAAGDDATTGIWNRMDPEGTSAQPEDDHTPVPGTICWVTDGFAGGSLGANDVDNGKTTLTSPAVDLSGSGNAVFSYWRWYSNNTGASPNADVFIVEISNDDGATWTNVETVGPSGAGTSGGWVFHSFAVADFVAPSAQVRLRFVASDEGSGSIVEAAVDDLQVVVFSCESTCPADLNDDGIIDFTDLTLLLTSWAAGTTQGDIGGLGGCDVPDGVTDFFDLSCLLAAWAAGGCP